MRAGETLENPITQALVFAYRIELGHVEERPRSGGSDWEVERRFTPTTTDLIEYPSVVLRSVDKVKLLLRANSYRLVDAPDREGELLDPEHALAERIGEVPFGRLRGYRALSLSRGQRVTFVAELTPIESEVAGHAYRSVSDAPPEACTLEARPLDDGPIEIHDWPDLERLQLVRR
ncbi:MAG: hypothetical protein U0271_15285 [Polyangiaceae bacterium]